MNNVFTFPLKYIPIYLNFHTLQCHFRFYYKTPYFSLEASHHLHQNPPPPKNSLLPLSQIKIDDIPTSIRICSSSHSSLAKLFSVHSSSLLLIHSCHSDGSDDVLLTWNNLCLALHAWLYIHVVVRCNPCSQKACFLCFLVLFVFMCWIHHFVNLSCVLCMCQTCQMKIEKRWFLDYIKSTI